MLFPFDRKIIQNTRKIISIHIFTSNHFRTELQMRKEREREKEQDRSTRSIDESHPAQKRSHPLLSLEAHQCHHLDHHHLRSIHPKPILSSTYPRPSSFVEKCPKHWWVVPSIPETQKPRKPIPQTHFSDEPTTSTNPFRKLISQTPTGRHRSLSLSLTLKSLSHASLLFWLFCFDFCFFDCLYILILCNNICLDPKKMWETW